MPWPPSGMMLPLSHEYAGRAARPRVDAAHCGNVGECLALPLTSRGCHPTNELVRWGRVREAGVRVTRCTLDGWCEICVLGGYSPTVHVHPPLTARPRVRESRLSKPDGFSKGRNTTTHEPVSAGSLRLSP